jgi:hypothetical protein
MGELERIIFKFINIECDGCIKIDQGFAGGTDGEY